MSGKNLVNSIIDFSLPVLLITNVWIILYTKIVDYSFFLNPPQVMQVFFQRLAYPEPFEIPLYLFLTLFFLMLIWFYYFWGIDKLIRFYLDRFDNQKLQIIKNLFAFFLTIVFLTKLGVFPLTGDTHPLTTLAKPWLNLPIFFLYILFLGFVSVQTSILDKAFRSEKVALFIACLIVALVVALFTFNPGFPVSPLDSAMFYGPVWEIVNGKTIFTQVPSQYGFLSVLFFTLTHKLTGLNFTYFPIVIWLMYIVEYSLIFYLLRNVSRSTLFSGIAVFSIFTVNYLLSTYGPQASPLRRLPLFLAAFMLYRFQRLTSKTFVFLLPVLVLWSIDSGIALWLSYVFSLFFLLVLKKINLRGLISTTALLIISFLFWLALIQLFHKALGYEHINFLNMFYGIKKNAQDALLMVPMEKNTHFWLFILVYFASVIYFFINQLSPLGKISRKKVGVTSEVTLREADLRSDGKSLAAEKGSRVTESTFFENTILLFSANLMLFASIYYVGRSHPHNLFHISLFFVLTLFILAGILINKIKATGNKLFLLTSLFIMLVAYPAYQRQEALTSVFKEKMRLFRLGSIFIPETKQVFGNKYQQEIDLINKNFPDSKILILSDDDSYLYYLLQKKNYLNFNPQILNFAKSDLNFSLGQLLDECPKKIVADCRLFNRCQYSHPVNQTYVYVQPYIFEKLSGDCNIRYEPEQCTSHLCIGSAR